MRDLQQLAVRGHIDWDFDNAALCLALYVRGERRQRLGRANVTLRRRARTKEGSTQRRR